MKAWEIVQKLYKKRKTTIILELFVNLGHFEAVFYQTNAYISSQMSTGQLISLAERFHLLFYEID